MNQNDIERLYEQMLVYRPRPSDFYDAYAAAMGLRMAPAAPLPKPVAVPLSELTAGLEQAGAERIEQFLT